MELVHLSGSTYCFSNPSTIGVYFFDGGSCLLIDTGAKREQAQMVLDYLDELKIRVHSIFNTHHHADHCTGNQLIQNSSNCQIYASAIEAALIENPLLTPYSLYSAYPPPVLRNKYLLAPPSRVTDHLDAGEEQINGVSFRILDLKGHTLGQLGIMTPDSVAFLGDSLLAEEHLDRLPFPYLADAREHFATLDYLEKCRFSVAMLTHSGRVADLPKLVRRNRDISLAVIETILKLTKQPQSREEIVAKLIENYSLPLGTTHYFLLHSSVSAFLSYLNSISRIHLRQGSSHCPIFGW